VIDRIDANEDDRPPEPEHEEAMTARLLRLAGMRAGVPLDREDRVRRAVLDECRTVARARVVGRRTAIVAVVLSVAAAALVAVRFGVPRVGTPPVSPIVGTVERVEGSGGHLSAQSGSIPRTRIGLADTVRVGDQIETGATDRVGLRLSERVSLRLDQGSRARLLSASKIELSAGAVYVDSGTESPDLEVHTSFGIVKDIGTQFELRLGASSLRVRVRSGVVEVRRGNQVSSARPGTELTLGAGGASSSAVVPYGPEWAWAARLGPPFEIEGRPLGAFLEHLCREQGWTLAYTDAKLEREASGIILHGSTEGQQPSDALAIVLATTGLTHRFKDGELLVTRSAQP
jgi:ferric-dicitrate binding protein FerR (iron transport regulator)